MLALATKRAFARTTLRRSTPLVGTRKASALAIKPLMPRKPTAAAAALEPALTVLQATKAEGVTPPKRGRRTKAQGGIEQLSSLEVQQIALSPVPMVKKSAGGAVVEEETAVEAVVTPKKRRARTKVLAVEDDQKSVDEAEATRVTASGKRKRRSTVAVTVDADVGTPVSLPLRRSGRARKPVTPAAEVDEALDEALEESPKKRRKRKTDEPVPYVIPPVERLQTSFKGRLGYACLNTVLRTPGRGQEPVFCSRTCRLETMKQKGMDLVKELGLRNVEDLGRMIEWNERNKCAFFHHLPLAEGEADYSEG